MNVLILLLFIGAVLVTYAVGFFVWSVRRGTLQHVDRLSLLPLDDDSPRTRGGTLREVRAVNAPKEGSR